MGRWGWLWYGGKEGMKQYDQVRSELRPGDWLVAPKAVPIQAVLLDQMAAVRPVGEKAVPGDTWTFFRTGRPAAGYYHCTLNRLPWTLSRAPLEDFMIYRVIEDPKPPADVVPAKEPADKPAKRPAGEPAPPPAK